MTTIPVTVVIPTRDRRDRLKLALRSALGQRDVDLEVIVVDDGSNDDTEAVVGAIGDPRLRLLRNETSTGVSVARNRGVAAARGMWIAFLDDDDVWAPEKLSRQLATLRECGLSWAYGGEVIVDRDLQIVDGSPPPSPDEVLASLPSYNSVPAGGSNVVVSAELLGSVGPFDPHLATSEDWDMWIRLARDGPPACVQEPLVAVRLDGARAEKMSRMLDELHVVSERHGIRVEWARHYRWAAWEALRGQRRREAVRYYRAAIAAGDLMSIGRLAVALMAPGSSRRRSRPIRGNAWLEEAESWIQALRGNHGAETDGYRRGNTHDTAHG